MRSVELFSGAGGLALGMEAAGFETVALIERNKPACATLRANRPAWNVLESDVRKIRFAEFGNIDVVAGGPPCQPFSMGGKARGYDDTRDMFPQAVRAVRELRPKAFLFENVRGLLRPAFRNYVEYVRLQLTYPVFPISANVSWDTNLRRLQRHHTSSEARDLTYRVSIHTADAADYGVPQRRHRVFFVGFREDVDARWSFPVPTNSHDELLLSQFVTGGYWKEHGLRGRYPAPSRFAARLKSLTTQLPLGSANLRWQTVRDAIRGLGEPKASDELGHQFQPGARSYPGHTGSPLDEPAKALKAGDHGVPGGENMLCKPDGSVRYFSIRESARIQSFPDDYWISGSWTESMRQLGNAVPVRLAEIVSGSIARHLDTRHGRLHRVQPA